VCKHLIFELHGIVNEWIVSRRKTKNNKSYEYVAKCLHVDKQFGYNKNIIRHQSAPML